MYCEIRYKEYRSGSPKRYGGRYLPDITFFLELAERLGYNTVQILATLFKYYKRILNIGNVFENFFKCSWNI